MTKAATRTNPKLWAQVKTQITRSAKGGRAGQWSARKAQMAVQEYKRRGGGYVGPKQGDNSLVHWTREDWGTKSGKPSTKTGERYLPRRARDELSSGEYAATTRKKRADTRKGHRVSKQPAVIAAKTATARQKGKASTRSTSTRRAQSAARPHGGRH